MLNLNKIILFLLLLLYHLLMGQIDNVLFVGNSVTYYNDMPELFRNIAASKGKNIDVTSYTVGGVGLAYFVNDNLMYQKIRSKKFDYVIIQPGTGESAGYTSPVAKTANRGMQLKDSIRKYSPCSKIFLYEIPYGVPSQNGYPEFFHFQKMIKDSVMKMSNLMQVGMIPAGEAARVHYSSVQDLALHSSYNDIHPSVEGSYLIASTIFSTLFQTSVYPSIYYGGINQTKAQNYQQVASNVFSDNPSQWNINTFDLHANFDFNISGKNVNLFNTSTNYDSLHWDFGDGSYSTSVSPSHHYLSDGLYNISLKVNRGICSETISKSINVFNSKFYPNPVIDYGFLISKKHLKKTVLYSVDGRRIEECRVYSVSENTYKIDLLKVPTGVYILNFYYADESFEALKIIKSKL